MKCLRIYFFIAFCASCGIAIILLGAAVRAGAQTASTDPSFEVATIKPVIMDASHPFDPRHYWAQVYPDRASYWSMTLKSLIAYAYDVQEFQVSGPESIDKDYYDIEAKLPDGAIEGDDKKMLQVLLKDRFQLKFHIEKRELEAYALVVGKHGAKLKPSLPDPPNPGTAATVKPADSNAGEGASESKIVRNPDGSSTFDMGKRGTQTVKFDRENSAMHYERSKMTMEELAGRLGGCLGRDQHMVDDRTGIKGDYQIAFDCPMRPPRPAMDGIPSDPEGSSPLVESLDALGLKLEKRKVPMDVYVIDQSEKPSVN
ncbi:MAG: TIGR03435 family protein [Terracidiphilus sp.]